MMDKDLVYLHLQRIMIDHSNNFKLLKTRANGILGWLGIPKEFRNNTLKILEEKKLIKELDRYKIQMINTEKSNEIDKKLNKLLWEGFLE